MSTLTFKVEIPNKVDANIKYDMETGKTTVLADSKVNTEPLDNIEYGKVNHEIFSLSVELNPVKGTSKTPKDVTFDNLQYALLAVTKERDWVKYIPEEVKKLITKEYTLKEEPEVPENKDNHLDFNTALTFVIKETISKISNFFKRQSNKVYKVDLTPETAALLNSNKTEENKDEAEFSWIETYKPSDNKGIIGYSYDRIDNALKSDKKAVILEGVPGTGKTRMIVEYLENKIRSGETKRDNTCLITFHQEYSHTDFIGGQRFINGKFVYVDGVFTTMCKKASCNPSENFYIGIDELSRGSTETILGAFLTAVCIRGKAVDLAFGRKLVIPDNLYILASMNITDRSTKKIDIATSQRFEHIYIEPQWNTDYIEMIMETAVEDVREELKAITDIMVKVNELVKEERSMGEHCVIGTRDITIKGLNKEKLCDAVVNGLIPSIRRCTMAAHGEAEASIEQWIEDIRSVINV